MLAATPLRQAAYGANATFVSGTAGWVGTFVSCKSDWTPLEICGFNDMITQWFEERETDSWRHGRFECLFQHCFDWENNHPNYVPLWNARSLPGYARESAEKNHANVLFCAYSWHCALPCHYLLLLEGLEKTLSIEQG
jgi:hypothetical protein